MAKSVVTHNLNLHNARQFIESISEAANSVYYVFAARNKEYPDGDSIIPQPIDDNEDILYDVYDHMIFGKRVGSDDVSLMVARHNWTTGTVYDKYRDDQYMFDKKFFVVVDEGSYFHVYKCLDNNLGSSSTVPPTFSDTGADDEFYGTSDGYHWKYMYSIDSTTFDKFATTSLMPVIPNANVSGNAVSGSIDVINVIDGGSHYNTYLTGQFSGGTNGVPAYNGNTVLYTLGPEAMVDLNYYVGSRLFITAGTGVGQSRRIVGYHVDEMSVKIAEIDSPFTITPDTTSQYEITPNVLVTGDGSFPVKARALVNTAASNTIYKIEILDRGAGFTYAYATVQGYQSGLPGGGFATQAVLQPVLGPRGGHGADIAAELGSRYVCISTTYANNEHGLISVSNDYRQIGVLKDPLYANIQVEIDPPTTLFPIGDTVTMYKDGAATQTTGVVTANANPYLNLTNVAGIFEAGNTTVVSGSSNSIANIVSVSVSSWSNTFNVFDQRYKFTYTGSANAFVEDATCYQGALSLANATIHSVVNSSMITMTNMRGLIDPGAELIESDTLTSIQLDGGGRTLPDLVKGSGEVLYIQNRSPITRSNTQSELIKIVLKF